MRQRAGFETLLYCFALRCLFFWPFRPFCRVVSTPATTALNFGLSRRWHKFGARQAGLQILRRNLSVLPAANTHTAKLSRLLAWPTDPKYRYLIVIELFCTVLAIKGTPRRLFFSSAITHCTDYSVVFLRTARTMAYTH